MARGDFNISFDSNINTFTSDLGRKIAGAKADIEGLVRAVDELDARLAGKGKGSSSGAANIQGLLSDMQRTLDRAGRGFAAEFGKASGTFDQAAASMDRSVTAMDGVADRLDRVATNLRYAINVRDGQPRETGVRSVSDKDVQAAQGNQRVRLADANRSLDRLNRLAETFEKRTRTAGDNLRTVNSELGKFNNALSKFKFPEIDIPETIRLQGVRFVAEDGSLISGRVSTTTTAAGTDATVPAATARPTAESAAAGQQRTGTDAFTREAIKNLTSIMRATSIRDADRQTVQDFYAGGGSPAKSRGITDLELEGQASGRLVESAGELRAAQLKTKEAQEFMRRETEQYSQALSLAKADLVRSQSRLQGAEETGAAGQSLAGFKGAVTKAQRAVERAERELREAEARATASYREGLDREVTASDLEANRAAQRTSSIQQLPRGVSADGRTQYGSLYGQIPTSVIDQALAAERLSRSARSEAAFFETARFLDARPDTDLNSPLFTGVGAEDRAGREAAKYARAAAAAFDRELIQRLQGYQAEGRLLSAQQEQALAGARTRESQRDAARSRGVLRDATLQSLFGEGTLPGSGAGARTALNRIYRDPKSYFRNPEELLGPNFEQIPSADRQKIARQVLELQRSMRAIVKQVTEAIAAGADPDQVYAQAREKILGKYEALRGTVQKVGPDFQGRFQPLPPSDSTFTRGPRVAELRQLGVSELRSLASDLGANVREPKGGFRSIDQEVGKLIGAIIKAQDAARAATNQAAREDPEFKAQQERKLGQEALEAAKDLQNLGAAIERERLRLQRSATATSYAPGDVTPPGRPGDQIGPLLRSGYFNTSTEQLVAQRAEQDRFRRSFAEAPDAEIGRGIVASRLGVEATQLPADMAKLDTIIKQYIRFLQAGLGKTQAASKAIGSLSDPLVAATVGAKGDVSLSTARSSGIADKGLLFAGEGESPKVLRDEADRLIIRVNGEIQGYLDYIVRKVGDQVHVETGHAYISPEGRQQGAYSSAQRYLEGIVGDSGGTISHSYLTAQGAAALSGYVDRSGTSALHTVDPDQVAARDLASPLQPGEQDAILAQLRQTIDTANRTETAANRTEKSRSESQKGKLREARAQLERLRAQLATDPGNSDLADEIAAVEKAVADLSRARKPRSGGTSGGGSGGSGSGATVPGGGRSNVLDVRVIDIAAAALSKIRSISGSGTGTAADQAAARANSPGALERAVARLNAIGGQSLVDQVRGTTNVDQLARLLNSETFAGADRRRVASSVARVAGVDEDALKIAATKDRTAALAAEAREAAAKMLAATADTFNDIRRQLASGQLSPYQAVARASTAAQNDPALAGLSSEAQKKLIGKSIGLTGPLQGGLLNDAFNAGKRIAIEIQRGVASQQGGVGEQLSGALGFRNAEGDSTFSQRVFGAAGNFFVRDIAAGAYFSLANNLQTAVRAGLEAETTFVRVSAALEDTGRSADGLRTSLQKTSVSTGAALDQVYETAAQLVGVFENVRDVEVATDVLFQLQLISGGALTTQEGFRALSSVTSAYGLEGSSALRQVADMATYLQNQIGVNIEDTLEGAARLAPLAQQLGFSLEEIATIAGEAGKKTGQTGQVASEQVGRILSRFQDAGNQKFLEEIGVGTEAQFQQGQVGDVFKELLAEYDSFSPQLQARINKTFGGDREAASFAAIFEDPARALEVMEGAANASGEAMERTRQIMAQIGTQIKLLGTNFANLAALLIRSGFLDVLGAGIVVLNKVLEVINDVGSAINDLFDSNPITAFFKRIVAGFAGVLIAVKLLKPVLGDVFSATPGLRALPGVAGAAGAVEQAAAGQSGLVGPDGRPLSPSSPQPRQTPGVNPLVDPARRTNILGAGIAAGGRQLTSLGQRLTDAAATATQSGSRWAGVMTRGADAANRVGGRMAEVNKLTDETGRNMSRFSRGIAAVNNAVLAGLVAWQLISSAISAYNNAVEDEIGSNQAVIDERKRREEENAQESQATTEDNQGGTFAPGPVFGINPLSFDKDNLGVDLRNFGGALQRAATLKNPLDAYDVDVPGEYQAMIDQAREDFIGIDSALREAEFGFGAERPQEGASEAAIEQYKDLMSKRAGKAGEYLDEVDQLMGDILVDLDEKGYSQAVVDKAQAELLSIRQGVVFLKESAETGLIGLNEINLVIGEELEDLVAQINFTNSLNTDTIARQSQYIETYVNSLGLPDRAKDRYLDSISGDTGPDFTLRRSAPEDRQVDPSKLSELERLRAQLRLARDVTTYRLADLQDAQADGAEADVIDQKRQALNAAIQSEEAARGALQQYATSRIELSKFFLETGQTEKSIQAASKASEFLQRQIDAWQGSKNDPAYQQLLESQRAAREALIDAQYARGDAQLTREAAAAIDSSDQAKIALQQAQRALDKAKELGDTGPALAEAQAAVTAARIAYSKALFDESQAIAQAQSARIDDPIERAQAELATAYDALAFASTRSAQEYEQALTAVEQAEDNLQQAQAARTAAIFGLRQATADAAGKVVQSARIQLNAAEAALRAAQQAGDQTAIIQAQAQVVTAQAALRDAALQERIDTIDFRAEMGRITAAEEIRMLQRLLKERDLTRQQRRELLLKIKGLKDELNSDLTSSGFNIGDIDLPTAYQVRRSLGIDPVRNGGGTTVNNATTNNNRIDVRNEFKVMSEAQADQIARRVAKMIGDEMDRQSRSSGASPRLV